MRHKFVNTFIPSLLGVEYWQGVGVGGCIGGDGDDGDDGEW